MTNPGEKRHTAGPWAVDDEACFVFGRDGHMVAELRGFGVKRTEGEIAANGDLIAAAPDLYEALKGLLESKALQEAPFYNYSEAVLRGREALSRAVPEGGRE